MEKIQKKAAGSLSLIYNNSVDNKYTELIYVMSDKITDKYSYGRSIRRMLFETDLVNVVNIVNQRDDMKI